MKIHFYIPVLIFVIATIRVLAIWEPYGPEGITANKITFLLDDNDHVGICHDEGIFLYNYNSGTWIDFPTDLPVHDAYYLNGEDILVIMGCGTDSDGIYSFSPETGEFTIIEFLECPYFIAFDEILQKYYTGHHLGLEISFDGLNWTPVSDFDGMSMVAMDIYQNHLVVSQMDNLYSIWHSDDHGNTWVRSPAGSPMISDLCFDYNQKLYGIFPDESWSSGLWSSTDYGYTWEVEFWSINMSCAGIDAMGDIITGWDYNPNGGDEGIAHYEPEGGTITFINEGLSNLVINDICINPAMSALALFCCTDSGAYVSYDYMDVPDTMTPTGKGYLEIFPNPASEILNVVLPSGAPKVNIKVYNVLGQIVEDFNVEKSQVAISLGKYPRGIYYIGADDGVQTTLKKFIKE